jgi:2-dehydropantoate 2-reductase
VGGFLAARLADAGCEVTVLVRPRRAAALSEAGLVIRDGQRSSVTRPAVVTAERVRAGYDAIVLAVKADALDGALDDVAAAVSASSVVIPFLNGMGHLGRLTERFGSAVIGGVLRVATELEPDGSIRVLDPIFEVELGELDGRSSGRVDELAAAFRSAGAHVSVSSDIVGAMWAKWVYSAAIGAVTGLMRAPVGDVEAAPGGVAFARRVVGEAAAAAAAAGHPVPGPYVQALERVTTTPGSGLTSSLSRDLIAGRRTEVEAVLGDLAERSAGFGLDAPLLAASALALRIHNARVDAARADGSIR